jgi:hypothetical protein
MYDLRGAGMNTIKVYKRIESNDIHIDGLDQYIGKEAEIIIHIDEFTKDDLALRKKKAEEFMSAYSGKVTKWTRDELYDR